MHAHTHTEGEFFLEGKKALPSNTYYECQQDYKNSILVYRTPVET